MTPKQERTTRQIELVETHNIALSLRRIGNSVGWDKDQMRKRAIYHAVLMEGQFSRDEKAKIREALNLP